VQLFETLTARHLVLTGRPLAPRLVVTDFEVRIPVRKKIIIVKETISNITTVLNIFFSVFGRS
jgi:hypothetical protein